jgi:hypothetical protein
MHRPRPAWAFVAALCALVAGWIDLGEIHAFHHSDSLLPVLVSTQRWTPFYWGQDRYGMLVPLLAMPFRNPLVNLLVQDWLMIFAGLLAPFLVARFFVERPVEWMTAGALANAMLVVATSPFMQFDWLVSQPYGLSIGLGFAGLVVVDRRADLPRAACALFLLLTALWVNVGVFGLLGAAVVLRRPNAWQISLLLCAISGGLLLARYLSTFHTTTALTAVALWPAGWWRLAQNGASVVANRFAVATIVAVVIAGVVMLARREPGSLLTRAGVPAAVALIYGLVVGTSLWVDMNLYQNRYTYPSWMMLAVAASIVVTMAFRRQEVLLCAASGMALVAACLAVHPAPSMARVTNILDDRFSPLTAAVITNGVTAIAGNYWTVWPAVFHANVVLSRSKSDRHVYGMTFRSEVTDPMWQKQPRILVGGAPTDRLVGFMARRHGVHLTPLERRPAIHLWVGQPVAIASSPR